MTERELQKQLRNYHKTQIMSVELAVELLTGCGLECMYDEALNMAIQALQQQPCEDAISRQAVLEYIEGSWAELGHSSENELVCQDIKKLPSVTSQPKMGRWIEHFDEIGKWYECDQCHTDCGGSVNYCPNCGADMRKESKE